MIEMPDTTYVPISVLQDVDKRIADWFAAGGKETDPYVKRQLEYLERVNNLSGGR